MKYTIENELLRVTVLQKGAELASVIVKETGEERIWKADPKVWARHAPLLFPHCGKLLNNTLQAEEESFPAAQHGFARDMVFELVEQQPERVLLCLKANEETRAIYPYDFALEVEFVLQGNIVAQHVTVKNQSENKVLPFNVGFHPGFALPFGDGAKTEDYEIVFEKEETPVLIKTPMGYVSGERETLFEGKNSITMTDTLFANDSLCLTGLVSSHVALRNKQGAGVKVAISSFPYVLLWGPASGPLPFMCIEPWHGLPDGPDEYGDFSNKPGVTKLAPKEDWSTTLEMEFT